MGGELLQAKHFLKLFRNFTNDIGEVGLDLGLWQCQDGDRDASSFSSGYKEFSGRYKKRCRDKGMASNYGGEKQLSYLLPEIMTGIGFPL